MKERSQGVDAAVVSFVLAVSYSMIPASMITQVIMERNERLKHY